MKIETVFDDGQGYRLPCQATCDPQHALQFERCSDGTWWAFLSIRTEDWKLRLKVAWTALRRKHSFSSEIFLGGDDAAVLALADWIKTTCAVKLPIEEIHRSEEAVQATREKMGDGA